MPRPTLEQIAAQDLQVRRFLDKAKGATQVASATKAARKPAYQTNHIPRTRDLSAEAIEAINACTTR